MDENWKKQSMPLILAPTHLDNDFDEKGRKTNGTIGIHLSTGIVWI